MLLRFFIITYVFIRFVCFNCVGLFLQKRFVVRFDLFDSNSQYIHAKLKERLDKGEDLPQYLKEHPIYYAGPAKTPAGMACGSMGPTTAGRMDSYVDLFQSHGGSMPCRIFINTKLLPVG